MKKYRKEHETRCGECRKQKKLHARGRCRQCYDGIRRSPGQTKKLSRRPHSKSRKLDNLYLWIQGSSELGNLIDDMERNIAGKSQSIRSEMERYHKKTVKGKEYWYLASGGGWKYIGKKDPRPDLEVRIEKLDMQATDMKDKFLSCVVKRFRDHVVIDSALFKLHISKALPRDIIPLNKLSIREIQGLAATG